MKFRREIVEAAFSTARAARLTGFSPHPDLLYPGQLMLVFPVAREAEAVASAVQRLEREEEELSPAPRRAGGRGR